MEYTEVSERERLILNAAVQPKTVREIAETTGYSANTTSTYVKKLIQFGFLKALPRDSKNQRRVVTTVVPSMVDASRLPKFMFILSEESKPFDFREAVRRGLVSNRVGMLVSWLWWNSKLKYDGDFQPGDGIDTHCTTAIDDPGIFEAHLRQEAVRLRKQLECIDRLLTFRPIWSGSPLVWKMIQEDANPTMYEKNARGALTEFNIWSHIGIDMEGNK